MIWKAKTERMLRVARSEWVIQAKLKLETQEKHKKMCFTKQHKRFEKKVKKCLAILLHFLTCLCYDKAKGVISMVEKELCDSIKHI